MRTIQSVIFQYSFETFNTHKVHYINIFSYSVHPFISMFTWFRKRKKKRKQFLKTACKFFFKCFEIKMTKAEILIEQFIVCL